VTQDVSDRILQLFEVRLLNNPDVSQATVDTIVEGQRDADFGDDEELLAELVDAMRSDA
jgi:diaminopimelate decarboxylase